MLILFLFPRYFRNKISSATLGSIRKQVMVYEQLRTSLRHSQKKIKEKKMYSGVRKRRNPTLHPCYNLDQVFFSSLQVIWKKKVLFLLSRRLMVHTLNLYFLWGKNLWTYPLTSRGCHLFQSLTFRCTSINLSPLKFFFICEHFFAFIHFIFNLENLFIFVKIIL